MDWNKQEYSLSRYRSDEILNETKVKDEIFADNHNYVKLLFCKTAGINMSTPSQWETFFLNSKRWMCALLVLNGSAGECTLNGS